MKISRQRLKEIIKEEISEAAKRDYKAEYKKFQSSTKSKKYRAELNKYNRQKGTYGNGDGKDASHKNGKIVGFEAESKNRGRREKSRLKKEGTCGYGENGEIGEQPAGSHLIKKKKKLKKESWDSPQPYSSKEAKSIIDGAIKNYSKELRKVQYKVVKDWMSKAKSGVIDYFDIVRGLQTGDIKRAHPYETDFLHKVLTKDKIIDRFRSYFGGKKGFENRRKNQRGMSK